MRKLEIRLIKKLMLWSQKRYADLRQADRIHRGLSVSEHTLVRYFERVEGYNIDKIREEIVSDGLYERVLRVGSGRFLVGRLLVTVRVKKNGFPFIITLWKSGKNAPSWQALSEAKR